MLTYRLSDSGYPVYHYFKPDSSITEVQIVSSCGAIHEDADSHGVAHFLEHMAFQGTPDKNKHQISREMGVIGHYNAYTSHSSTVYHFDSLNEKFEQGFQLLKESVFDSNYPEDEFEKEKRVIIEEWRMYDNDPSTAYRNFVLEEYLKVHPIIGTEESIESMNPEKLHRYRDRWYGESNIAIVIVGGVSVERAMEVVNACLPKARSVETTPAGLNDHVHDEQTRSFETDRYQQAIYGLMQPWTPMTEILSRGYIPSFMTKALSTYLYEYIRDDLGLCYNVAQGRFEHRQNSYLMTFLLTNRESLEKSEEELFNSYAKIKNEGFPQEIFEIAKVQATYNQLKTLQDVEGIADSIVSLIGSGQSKDWVLEEGIRCLDAVWLKDKADNLTPKDLQNFAIEKLGVEVSKFSMIPIDAEASDEEAGIE